MLHKKTKQYIEGQRIIKDKWKNKYTQTIIYTLTHN